MGKGGAPPRRLSLSRIGGSTNCPENAAAYDAEHEPGGGEGHGNPRLEDNGPG
jgi:hypothetical protein